MAQEPASARMTDHRTNNFDFLRFLFATIVLLTHCYFFFPNPPAWTNRSGSFAVDGFFVISGYLILISYLSSRSIGSYVRKRVLRIYPAYLACMALCTVVLAPLGAANVGAYFHSLHPLPFLVRTLLFLTPGDLTALTRFADQPMANTLDLSIWTLSYEVACYGMIVLLGVIGALRARAAIAALFTAALLANTVQSVFFPDFYQTVMIHGHAIAPVSQALRLVTFFLAGMTMYLYRDTIPLNATGLWVVIPLILVGLVFDVAHWPALAFYLAFSAAVVYGVLSAAFTRLGPLNRFAKWGDISYGLYLYAWPCSKLFMLYFGPHLNVYTLFLLVFPATCLAATLSWFLVEKPMLRWKSGSEARAVAPMSPESVTPDKTAFSGVPPESHAPPQKPTSERP